MNKKLYFNLEMVAPASPGSFSRSWEKPRLFFAQAMGVHGVSQVDVYAANPVSAATMALAHDPRYVNGVLSGRISNGFGSKDPALALSCQYTVGGMVDATLDVLHNGGMACVPVSGFHHAGYDFGSGFCTFNGLMVAALHALAYGGASSVGIFDADQHYGDGTDDIIKVTGLKPSTMHHWTTGAKSRDPVEFLLNLRRQLVVRFSHVDVLLYQAGADCHVDDPLGGWMNTEQMRLRDRIVFEFCAERQIPLVWDLAGGYQDPFQNVLDLHLNTFKEFLSV